MQGILSFCDILGYQSFLKNNEVSDSVEKVLAILTGAPNEVKQDINNRFLPPEVEEKGIADALKHLVFSDTIVLMLPYPDTVDERWRFLARKFMIPVTAILKCKMFKEGLPIRCAIEEGEFIVMNSSLAGKAVVEAYQLTESLDLSAMVLSNTLGEEIKKDEKFIFDRYYVDYLTPRKDKEEKLVHFNWLMVMDTITLQECIKDVDKFVLKSFWAHKKDCPVSVDKKVNATAKLIRRLLIAKGV